MRKGLWSPGAIGIEPLERRALLATVDWIGGPAGNWNDGANWSSGTVPGLDDDVRIIGDDTTQPFVTLDSGEHSISTLTAQRATLEMSAGALTIVNGGTFTGAGLALSDGTLTTAVTTGTHLSVDTAAFKMSGGLLKGDLLIGFSSAFFWTGGEMASPGTTTVPGNAYPYNYIKGESGTPILSRPMLYRGRGLSMSGNIVFNNGTFTLDSGPYGLGLGNCSIIDGGGTNLLRVSAGILFVNEEARVQVPAQIESWTWLYPYGDTQPILHLLGGGSAELVRGSGTVYVGGPGYHFDRIGDTEFRGSVQFDGGVSTVADAGIEGDLRILGPETQVTFTGEVSVGGALTGTGQVLLDGAVATITGGAGMSELHLQQGAAATFGNYLNVSGTAEVAAGSLLQLNNASAHIGALDINAGAQVRLIGGGSNVLRTASLSLDGNGILDIRRESLIVDYGTSSPLANIRSLLTSGYNDGEWNGSGIHSSFAAGEGRAVGYAEAAQLFSTFPATFAGQSVDDTTVVVTCTRIGDADLDRAVTIADFDRLAANFGHAPAALWTQGNFNYDERVNLKDFNLLAGNFGQSLAPSTGTIFSAVRLLDDDDSMRVPAEERQ